MTNASGLELLDYVAVVLYLGVTFGISIWFGTRQKSTEDFFLGGRRMPWVVVGLSILATLFSTISYLGMPGEFVKNGITIFTGYLVLPLNALVITLLWIPFFMRLRLTSAYEYLELRFSPEVRRVGASLFVLLRLGWMSMVVYVGSMALDRVKGPDLEFLPGNDLYWWIGMIGAVSAVYTAIGGIQAVIWVDVLQCVLLLWGVLMTIGYVLIVDGTTPVDWWGTASVAMRQHTVPPVFSLDPFVRVTIVTAMLNNFFWTICTHGSDQVVLQRYFSTSSLQSARRSYFINMGVDLLMASLLTLAGLALLAFYVKRPELLGTGVAPQTLGDKLFPHFLGSLLPAGCAGLIMSAFLSDAIQTLESGVNAITAVITRDVLVGRRRNTGEAAEPPLYLVRLLTLGVTVVVPCVACLVAYVIEKYQLAIIDMMPKFFNMFVGPLAAMFFVGMFVPRCTGRSLLIAVALGMTVSFFWSWSGVLWGKDWALSYGLSIAVPCLTTVGVAALLGALCDPYTPRAKYLWRSVVRRPLEG